MCLKCKFLNLLNPPCSRYWVGVLCSHFYQTSVAKMTWNCLWILIPSTMKDFLYSSGRPVKMWASNKAQPPLYTESLCLSQWRDVSGHEVLKVMCTITSAHQALNAHFCKWLQIYTPPAVLPIIISVAFTTPLRLCIFLIVRLNYQHRASYPHCSSYETSQLCWISCWVCFRVFLMHGYLLEYSEYLLLFFQLFSLRIALTDSDGNPPAFIF